MKETGVVGIRTMSPGLRSYEGHARLLLGKMKNFMQFGSMTYFSKSHTLQDGTVIITQSNNGLDYVWIYPKDTEFAEVYSMEPYTPGLCVWPTAGNSSYGWGSPFTENLPLGTRLLDDDREARPWSKIYKTEEGDYKSLRNFEVNAGSYYWAPTSGDYILSWNFGKNLYYRNKYITGNCLAACLVIFDDVRYLRVLSYHTSSSLSVSDTPIRNITGVLTFGETVTGFISAPVNSSDTELGLAFSESASDFSWSQDGTKLGIAIHPSDLYQWAAEYKITEPVSAGVYYTESDLFEYEIVTASASEFDNWDGCLRTAYSKSIDIVVKAPLKIGYKDNQRSVVWITYSYSDAYSWTGDPVPIGHCYTINNNSVGTVLAKAELDFEGTGFHWSIVLYSGRNYVIDGSSTTLGPYTGWIGSILGKHLDVRDGRVWIVTLNDSRDGIMAWDSDRLPGGGYKEPELAPLSLSHVNLWEEQRRISVESYNTHSGVRHTFNSGQLCPYFKTYLPDRHHYFGAWSMEPATTYWPGGNVDTSWPYFQKVLRKKFFQLLSDNATFGSREVEVNKYCNVLWGTHPNGFDAASVAWNAVEGDNQQYFMYSETDDIETILHVNNYTSTNFNRPSVRDSAILYG